MQREKSIISLDTPPQRRLTAEDILFDWLRRLRRRWNEMFYRSHKDSEVAASSTVTEPRL